MSLYNVNMTSPRIMVAVFVALVGAACAGATGTGTSTPSGSKPDPASYAGPCTVDDECTVLLARDCAKGCSVDKVAVLASRRAAFGTANEDYAATCAASPAGAPCSAPVLDATTARCRGGACAVEASVVPKASDFSAGCTADTDCAAADDIPSACCLGCGTVVLASRKPDYELAVTAHLADCKRASYAPPNCPDGPCVAPTPVCLPGAAPRRCGGK